jgi:hypothetical protein
MSSKRSAVKTSECENVSKKQNKKMQGPHPGTLSEKYNLCIIPRSKGQCRDLTLALTITLVMDYKYIKVIAQSLIFISLSALW